MSISISAFLENWSRNNAIFKGESMEMSSMAEKVWLKTPFRIEGKCDGVVFSYYNWPHHPRDCTSSLLGF